MNRRLVAGIAAVVMRLGVVPAQASSLVYGGVTAGRSLASGKPSANNLGILIGVRMPFQGLVSIEVSHHTLSSWNSDLTNLAVVGLFPVASRTSLIMKAGVSHWRASNNGYTTSGNDPLFAVGATYRLPIALPVSVRGQYTTVRDPSGEINTAQVDVLYNF